MTMVGGCGCVWARCTPELEWRDIERHRQSNNRPFFSSVPFFRFSRMDTRAHKRIKVACTNEGRKGWQENHRNKNAKYSVFFRCCCSSMNGLCVAVVTPTTIFPKNTPKRQGRLSFLIYFRLNFGITFEWMRQGGGETHRWRHIRRVREERWRTISCITIWVRMAGTHRYSTALNERYQKESAKKGFTKA